MAHPTIVYGETTHTFLVLSGQWQSYGETLGDITRAGADGTAYQKRGKKAGVSIWHSVRDAENKDHVATIEAAYEAAKGHWSAVTTDDTNTHWSVMIVDVTNIRYRKITTAVGGLEENPSTFVVEADWHLQLTE